MRLKGPFFRPTQCFFHAPRALQILVVLHVRDACLARVDFTRRFGQRRQRSGRPEVLGADAENSTPWGAPGDAQINTAPMLPAIQRVARTQYAADNLTAEIAFVQTKTE